MVDIWIEFVKAIWILIPAYAANGFAPFARGKIPIDFGKKFFDKQRIFGKGKTFEGLFLGLFVGTLYGAVEWFLSPTFNNYASQFAVQLPTMTIFIAFMISFGALTGDLAGSFIKRRLKLKRGKNVLLLDQLDFVIGAIIFSYLFTEISYWMILIMLIITPIIHRAVCIIGYKLKFKQVPW